MTTPSRFPKDQFQRIVEANKEIDSYRKHWTPERIWEMSKVQPLTDKEVAEEMKKAFSSPISLFLWAFPNIRTGMFILSVLAMIVAVFAFTGAVFWGWRESTEVAILSSIVLVAMIVWIVMTAAVHEWERKYAHVSFEDMTPWDEKNFQECQRQFVFVSALRCLHTNLNICRILQNLKSGPSAPSVFWCCILMKPAKSII